MTSRRWVSEISTSAVLARVTAVGVMSSVGLDWAATASGAATATQAATDSPDPADFQIFGMPVAAVVWLFAGVIAVLVGLIGASRSARTGASAVGRLLAAGVEDADFSPDGRVGMGDAEADRS